MATPHFLLIPYPVLGHVNPLIQLSQILIKHGCNITFLNTEFSHKRLNNNTGAAGLDNLRRSGIKFVALPDGLGPEDDRSDQKKVVLSIKTNMPSMLPKLIQDVNASDVSNKITCIVATLSMTWALKVGHNLGIKGALLWPASATSLALCDFIPRLIHDGVIDSRGVPIRRQQIQFSSNMPLMDTQNFPWRGHDKLHFDHLVQEMQTMRLGEWWLCNTTYNLEPAIFSISARLLPIGPLMGSDSNKSSFWEEDTTCLEWLDQQLAQSVVYVSFGSMAVMDPNQFNELALGLDLLDKPFIWVVRPSNDSKVSINEYPHEFHGSRGKVVGWAPQKKILNHPALACFISHCGWNSTVEGVCGGIPFLCWPFAKDQLVNKSYVCDVWKIGLGLDKDENGIISKGEIRKKGLRGGGGPIYLVRVRSGADWPGPLPMQTYAGGPYAERADSLTHP
ncbi:hypothetical protein JHK85_022804 [Glycine max]|nr:hypothetical protein JHK85_022804 [Glycine max]